MSQSAIAAPPSDFDSTTYLSGLSDPTAFRFAPNGDMYIAEKAGAIKRYSGGVVTTLATVPTPTDYERGLLGLELDQNFATNHYLYAAYTHTDGYSRLSRFTVTGNTIDLGSEVIFYKSPQPHDIYHNFNDIHVGSDGEIWLSTGDDQVPANAQSLQSPSGKILRFDTDGTSANDGPWHGDSSKVDSTYALGFRNPFRFTFLPNGKAIVGDVGLDTTEEINVIDKGANYGWPAYEGSCSGCGYANPVFSYPHNGTDASISALGLYTGSTFGSQYTNAMFYGDYARGTLRYLKFDSEFDTVVSDNAFEDDAGTIVDIHTGPDGNLYYASIFEGKITKVAPSGGNRAPVASASANPIAGLAPLPVAFSSAGSSDPEGTALTYSWNFGDGATSTAANPSHTYTVNGTYAPTLTVSDGQKTATASTSVTVGNRLPTATIDTPVAGTKYDAGDAISYSGSASDPEDGTLPASAFSWKVVLHHAEHIHPYLGPVDGVKSGTFTIGRETNNEFNTWYAIELTVTDSGGLKTTVERDINPNLSTMTIHSATPGGQFTVDGLLFTDTYTSQQVVGVEHGLGVPSPQTISGANYRFHDWSDGGAQTHTYRVPAADATVSSTLFQTAPVPAPWVSTDIGSPAVTGHADYDAANSAFMVDGGGKDIWGAVDEAHYVYQPLSGDGEIVTRVTSQTAADPWTKSGIMVKQSAAAGAPYAMVAVTPANGIVMQSNFNNDTGPKPSYTFPVWLKLKRVGNVFTGYYSQNGTAWTQLGQSTVAIDSAATAGTFVSAHTDTGLSTTVFDNVSVTPASQFGSLPSGWQHGDIGTVTPGPGAAGYATGSQTFSVTGGGNDIWGTDDDSHFAYQPLTGDGQIVARITSQTNTDTWAKAGVMIKGSTTPGSPYAAAIVTPGNGVHFQANYNQDQTGAAYAFPNAWLKLTRAGNVFTAYQSADGINWTQFAQSTLANMPVGALVGLFVDSHNGGTLGTATFDNVTVSSGSTGALPSPWASGDVGTPLLPGTSSYANGTFTVKGSGNDIWGTDDQFQFANQSLTGDGQIVARVTAQTNTDPWAKSGVMIKGSLVAGSPYSALMVTPANGVHMQSNFNSDTGGGIYAFPNAWLKLVRSGSTVTTYKSADGVAWTLVGTATVNLPATAKIGLFVCAHNGSSAFNTTTFDNVSVTASGGALPSGWSDGDIGAPAIGGSANYSANTFTVKGAGNDIWGATDQMHYAYKSLAGDGSIIARAVSQDNTDTWAKSGVMIKQSTTAGSAYAALFVTPGNGLHWQSGYNSDQSGGAATPPTWLKLTRAGNVVTAYTSANGTTWTQVGTPVTLSLTNPATIGLFVCSHNGSQLNTTTFDNVTVTP
jgi:glucose/arabinose dehydrogenase/regulation of enolase protein 1 (concanavalin A-like superfamily)